MLLDGQRMSVPLEQAGNGIVVNAGGYAFVRVAYTPELLQRLRGPALAHLSTIERFNLVSDTWAAVVACRFAAADYLDFVRGFADETSLPVWQAITAGLRGCDRLLADDARPRLAAHVRALVAPALQRLGWEPGDGEDQLTAQLRGLLLQTLADLGDDPNAQRRCRELFDNPDPDSIDPELLAAATRVVAAKGGAATFDRFVKEFRTASTPQRQLRFLMALADFDDEALVLRTCELAFSSEVRTQNAPFLLGRAIANRRHGATAWRYVREHWDLANEKFPTNSIVRMVDSVKLLNRQEDNADVQAFFSEHDIPQSRNTLAQILERQRVNTALRMDQEAPLTRSLA
jgi:puromycin-sensitive aminopeptidase